MCRTLQAEISLQQQGETPGADCGLPLPMSPRGVLPARSPPKPGGQRLQWGPFGPSLPFVKVIIFRTFYIISN